MVKTFLIAAMALASFVVSAQETQLAQQQQTGHYQMMEVTYTAPPDADSKTFKRLTIIDTVTGALTVCDYVYKDAGKDANGKEYWSGNGGCGPFVMSQGSYVPKNPKASKK